MSRSYKHVPCRSGNEHSRVPRRYKPRTIANRAVRRNEDIPNHSGYRKVYECYDRFDHIFFETEDRFLRRWKNGNCGKMLRKCNYKEAKRFWIKTYKTK